MSGNHVLVVDDEAINLMLIEDFLEQEQLALEPFSDPLAAWARMSAPGSEFSLVILDRMMPGMDGMEFLRRVKGDGRFADVPVIMQTAASAPEQVREGLEAGAYYYLTKPYAPEALISIVRAALEDRRARASLRTRGPAWKRRKSCCAVPSTLSPRSRTLPAWCRYWRRCAPIRTGWRRGCRT